VAPSVSRARLLAGLTRLIESRRRPDRVLRVAIDGPDAAGKTTLADALAARLAGESTTPTWPVPASSPGPAAVPAGEHAGA
jgi:hypothetical protein